MEIELDAPIHRYRCINNVTKKGRKKDDKIIRFFFSLNFSSPLDLGFFLLS